VTPKHSNCFRVTPKTRGIYGVGGTLGNLGEKSDVDALLDDMFSGGPFLRILTP
jgi:hypothetical protein